MKSECCEFLGKAFPLRYIQLNKVVVPIVQDNFFVISLTNLKQHVSAFKGFIQRSLYILQCHWHCNIYRLLLLLLYLLEL